MNLTQDLRMRVTFEKQPATRRLRRRHRRLVTAIGIAVATAIVFAIDWLTGIPHVQHLYYFPIIVAAIRIGMASGVGTAVVAIVLYHLANPQTLTLRYEEFDIVQMAIFVAAGVVAARLAEDGRRLRTLAMTDDLTGLHNLRSFELELRAMVAHARTTRAPVSLLVLDVDRLKSMNDEHGHLAGAEAVRAVGRIIADQLSSDAVACRYGGDEFVVALPQTNAAAAQRVADDLRRAVEANAPVLAGIRFPPGRLSISVGIASRSFGARMHAPASRADDDESEALFRAADAALYAAKNGGRNQVQIA
jgi:diguanylate cyclase (GGDEF)-like protein